MGEPISTGLIIGGGLSALGATAGSAISANGAESVNKQTMDYNHTEAMLNRAWQEQMYGRQLADQQAMYKQQLADQRETYEKYQSPAAIGQSIARLGVNPASVFGKVSGGSMPSVPSAPSVPSIASGSSASVSGLLNPQSAYAQGFQSVTSQASQLLSSISDSKLKDAQTLHTLRMAYGQQFTNEMLEISASIANWQIPAKAKAEINNLMAEAAVNNANKNLIDAKTSTEKIMKILKSNEANLTAQQVLDLSIRVAHLDSLLSGQEQLQFEQVKTEKSKQSVNYAGVKESLSRTDLNVLERDTAKAIQPYVKTIKRAEAYVAQSSAPSLIKKAEADVSKTSWFVELQKDEHVLRLLEARDKRAYTAIQRILHGKSITGDVSTVVQALSTLGDAEFAK